MNSVKDTKYLLFFNGCLTCKRVSGLAAQIPCLIVLKGVAFLFPCDMNKNREIKITFFGASICTNKRKVELLPSVRKNDSTSSNNF